MANTILSGPIRRSDASVVSKYVLSEQMLEMSCEGSASFLHACSAASLAREYGEVANGHE